MTGMIFLPETPRFLIKQDKHDKAVAALSKLRRLPGDHPALIEELAEIQANHTYELSLGKASYIDCFKGSIGKRLATGCALQGLQQLSGVNFIVCDFFFPSFIFPPSLPPPLPSTIFSPSPASKQY